METDRINLKLMPIKLTKERMVDSGMALTLIFIFIGIKTGTFIYFKLAILALLANMVFSKVFYPFAIFWYSLSNLLGAFMPKILFSILYFIIVLPTGLLRKLLGKDSLKLNLWKKGTASVMKSRNYTYTSYDLENPY